MIEELKIKDLKETLALVLKTFMEFEAPDYSEEGIREFKGFIKYNKIKADLLDEKFAMWVYKDADKIAGVIAGSNGHINLLFVDKDYHRRGIARLLFNEVLEVFKKNGVKEITVNSSPYAVEVYKKFGFVNAGGMQIKNGIKFYTMKREV